MKKRCCLLFTLFALLTTATFALSFETVESVTEAETDELSYETAFTSETVDAPGLNALTGNQQAFTFEAENAIDRFSNTQHNSKDLFTYDLVNDPTGAGYGKMLRVTLDTEKYLASYSESTYVYHVVYTPLDRTQKRPCLLRFDTYGKGIIGFWLGNTTHRNFGTLPSTASWYRAAANNSEVFSGSLSNLQIQYAFNGKNCDNIQYIDNLALIPYYKATYILTYPDGTSGTSIEKYFLCSDSAITSTPDGTLSGLPTAYTPENVGVSFEKYRLLGWSTEQTADTPMTSVPLANEDITLYPVWQKTYHEEYGEMVFLEDFEAHAGKNVLSGALNVSYIDPSFSTLNNHFTITRGDYWNLLNVTDDGSGNQALKVQMNGTSQRWPQFLILNNDATPKGDYTICASFMAPSDRIKHISDYSVRIWTSDGKYKNQALQANSSDIYQTVTATVSVGDGEAITKFQIYSSTDGSEADTYCYVDNIVLYRKIIQEPITLTLYYDNEKTQSQSFSLLQGDTYTFPTYAELASYGPSGYMPVGFRVNGKLYTPGQQITLPEQSTLEAALEFKSTRDTQYGELVFFEDFEAHAEKILYNGGSVNALNASYINPSFKTQTDLFTFSKGDLSNKLYVTDDGSGNQALAVQMTAASQKWPQFRIYNNGTLPEGEYTICVNFMAPSTDISHINNLDVRMVYSDSTYKQTIGGISSFSAGAYRTLTCSGLHSTAQALSSFQIFATTDGSVSDTLFFVDTIALYYRNNKCQIKLSDSQTQTLYFVPGGTVTLPRRYEVYESIPNGKVLKGFTLNGTLYAPGYVYTTQSSDTALTFEAVYESEKYTLAFDLRSGNGTVPECTVTDNQTVTLPSDTFYHSGADLLGWKCDGNDTLYAPGASYTFTASDYKASDFDEYGRLILHAVYSDDYVRTVSFSYNYELTDELFIGASDTDKAYLKIAYGAGILAASNTYDGTRSVTRSDLIDAAERLFYRSVGKTVDFENTTARLNDLVQKGICPAYTSLTENASNTDLALVLADVLPADSYRELCLNVTITGLSEDDDGYYEAQKLVRAGILPESTDFSAELTVTSFTAAIAKLIQPSLRTVENKPTFYVLGDSLTAGTGISQHTGWPRKLGNLLGENMTIVNYGIGGINTNNYFSAADTTANTYYKTMLSTIRPGDYVIIALGTNDSTLWERGQMTYETTRDNYYRYIKEIRAEGGVPILVCPVGRNTVDDSGVYIESDARIIECMNDVNTVYNANVTVIDFKTLSYPRFKAMTAQERAKIYYDSVHYTDYGAELVSSYFKELVTNSGDTRLNGLKNHFVRQAFDFTSSDSLYALATPTTETVTSFREKSPSGIRFKAHIGNEARELEDDVAEYGFIVALNDALDGKELTHSSDVRFAVGKAYHNLSDLDVLYDLNDEGTAEYTVVLYGMPDTKIGYTTVLAVRSYVRYGRSYFYGNTHTDSIYALAKRSNITDNPFIDHIIAISES